MKNLAKFKRWIESRKRKTEPAYEEAKKEFEMAMRKPFIEIRVEIPVGFEGLRSQFLSLEKDERFQEEIKDLVKKRLLLEKHNRKKKKDM